MTNLSFLTPALALQNLGLAVDWDCSFHQAQHTQYHIMNQNFNFRRAPFSVVQRTNEVPPHIRVEFLKMACANGRIDWDCFANNWHPEIYTNEKRSIEHCFSHFCVLLPDGERLHLDGWSVTPDYRRGNFYNHDLRSVERMLDLQDQWECEPDKYLFVAEWRGLVYYSDLDVDAQNRYERGYSAVRYPDGSPQTNTIPRPEDYEDLAEIEPVWAQSHVLYWPCPGLDCIRLTRCVREALNTNGAYDLSLLCQVAALYGIKLNGRVAQK